MWILVLIPGRIEIFGLFSSDVLETEKEEQENKNVLVNCDPHMTNAQCAAHDYIKEG